MRSKQTGRKASFCSLLPSPACAATLHEAAVPSLMNYFPTAIASGGADPWAVPGKAAPLQEADKWDESHTGSGIGGRSSQSCPKPFLLLSVDMSGVALRGLFKGRGSCLCTSEALDLCPLLSGLKGGNSIFFPGLLQDSSE